MSHEFSAPNSSPGHRGASQQVLEEMAADVSPREAGPGQQAKMFMAQNTSQKLYKTLI